MTGTENLAAIVGMVAALKEDLEKQEEHFQHIQNLETAFLAELEGFQYYLNRGEHHLPYVLNIGFSNSLNCIDMIGSRVLLEYLANFSNGQ